jgi:hypothetical protein
MKLGARETVQVFLLMALTAAVFYGAFLVGAANVTRLG